MRQNSYYFHEFPSHASAMLKKVMVINQLVTKQVSNGQLHNTKMSAKERKKVTFYYNQFANNSSLHTHTRRIHKITFTHNKTKTHYSQNDKNENLNQSQISDNGER